MCNSPVIARYSRAENRAVDTFAASRIKGFTMIELIVFIAVVGVAVAGILLVLNATVAKSSDPMIRKNMLSIAEALLEEVELMPYTYCDPSLSADPTQSWASAANTGACAGPAQGLGPPNGETRVSTTNPFNNVGDYSGASMPSQITDITGNPAAPAGYSASVALTPEALNGIASTSTPATMNVVRITVTVNYGTNSLVLEGYRARYWPNNLPW
jgi:MSHA pilin protein MshD